MYRKPDRRALLAKAHIGKKALGLDEDAWAGLVRTATGAASCRDLDEAGLVRLVESLKAKGVQFATPARAGQRPKNIDSASARAAQLGKIEALLADAGRPWAYVQAMAKRMYQKDRVQFCDSCELTGLIAALTRNAQREGRLVKPEPRS